MSIYIPEIFVAGAVPYGSQNPLEVAYHNISSLLDDEDINLITSTYEGLVYFIGAHSRDFVGAVGSEMPLACALPSIKEHSGDGVYTYPTGLMYAVIVKKGGTMRSFTAKKEVVEEYANSNKLPVYPAEYYEPIKWQWQGYRLHSLNQSRKIGKSALNIGSFIAVFFALLWVSLSAAESHFNKQSNKVQGEIVKDMQSAVSFLQANSYHKMENYFSDIQRLSVAARKNKGVINIYKLNGGNITWELKFPAWVTASAYSHLGDNLKVENTGSEIIVRKE